MHSQENDTIAAISTAPGEAAIAVIRVSGPNTNTIIQSIFRTTKSIIHNKVATYGWIIDPESLEKIDNVIVVNINGPNSMTGENLAEISCHGGMSLQKEIMEIVLKQGARIADRGEFTKRAFLNGKIDLIQAESVVEIIKARSAKSIKYAARNLAGMLSGEVSGIRTLLINILAEIEAHIDFPDDIASIKSGYIIDILESAVDRFDQILRTLDAGRMLNNGIAVSIIGRPNVGKSSILNALLKQDRAIVTDIPGTTTDTIEESINIMGFPFKLIDTAGLGKASNKIEEAGIKRTLNSAETANILIGVFDGSEDFSADDKSTLELMQSKRSLAVINKIDVAQRMDLRCLGVMHDVVLASAKQEIGMQTIENKLATIAGIDQLNSNDILISSLRQASSLRIASQSLKRAINDTMNSVPIDIVTIDIKEAVAQLGQTLGEDVTDEVISKIFETFCVGK